MSEEEKKREEILKVRAEHKRLSEMIQEGSRYHESVEVKTIDGEKHTVEVYALSENEFRELFEGAGVDPRDIGNRDKLVQNMKFLGTVAAKATRDEQICSILMPNQSAEIMLRCFAISGLAEGPKPESNAS